MRYYTTARISDNIHTTPEGFLLCIGVPIARIGQMIYMDGETPLEADDDGQVLISREEHEVFRPETIASFEGKAITISHPADAVTPTNWAQLAKGIIQNVRRGEGEASTDLIADFLIMDEVAINRVQNGLREVSCGYDADYIQTEPGRGFQTKIVGNHVALVDEGRAGPAYAINDAKGKNVANKIADRVKAIITKAQDEVAALVGGEGRTDNEDTGKTNQTGKTGKTSDKKSKDAETENAGNDVSLSDLATLVKNLAAKVDALTKGGAAAKDEETEDETETETATKDDEAEEDNTGGDDIGNRLEKLEQAVAKLLAAKSDEDDTDVDNEADEFNDAKNDGGGTGSEDALPKSTYTGDTVSRMEILAPGKKFKGKDGKAQALKAAYATTDGKKVIDQLTGNKGLTNDSAGYIHMLFTSASELLKQARQDELAGTRRGRVDDSAGENEGPKTAEDINRINQDFYKRK